MLNTFIIILSFIDSFVFRLKTIKTLNILIFLKKVQQACILLKPYD